MYVGLLFTLSLGMLALPGCDKKDGSSKKENDTASGKSSTDPGLNIQWVKVEGGTFTMGSPASEKGRYENEGPRHNVTLSDFWMSATEVTNAQYNAFLKAMEAKGGEAWERVKESGANYPGLEEKYKKDNAPVAFVSWDDAMAFCEWVGNGVTLPTEAQWEYACRAGNKGRFCFGEDETQLEKYAWYNANSDGVYHAVATKEANALGLYDMHGNVMEWCSDWYGLYTADPAKDPTGPESGIVRAVRGGAYSGEAWGCRSAYRLNSLSTNRIDIFGFRLVAPQAP